MDKKKDILERKDLRRNPYSVPEAYFDQLQERLGAIPRQEALSRREDSRTRIRPVLAWTAGIAAMLAVGLWVFQGSGTTPEPVSPEVLSYEQFAIADLIPHTEPYIFYEEDSQTPTDPAQEEMIDYLLQYQNY